MKNRFSKIKISFILSFVFLVVGLFTLKDYGINWDTINHLPRGQAYLHYFLTGNKNYSDLNTFKNVWQNPKDFGISNNINLSDTSLRSVYQADASDFNYFISKDGDGHPPLSDILSSIFNRILFGKLRLINDIDSYHVYGLLLAAMLVGLVFYWVGSEYGMTAGFISSITLALYPLFFSESHFNTEKDVPETMYWSFMFFSVWMAVTKKSWKWMLISGIFFGLALGTKFNILFAVFAIVPWIIMYFIRNYLEFSFKKTVTIILSGVVALAIGLGIFVGSWPYLWPDPLGRVSRVINFYKGIGIASTLPDPRFIGPFGTSNYSIQWILYATPILVLFLFFIGLFFIILNFKKEKKMTSLLFLFWFLVPIVRVTWDQANTYGGVRQIMEYIPPVAIFAGIGGSFIIRKIKDLRIKALIVFFVFIVLLIPIVKNHPNENVYFNSLTGGLSGAKINNFPYWGFSFGEAYRQGVEWINDHAENKAQVVFAYELLPNVPNIWWRPDLVVANSQRSGYLAKGEYAIALTYQGTDKRSYYDEYLDKFVEPVYQVKVDGVAILKVWKNDPSNFKFKSKELLAQGVKFVRSSQGLMFDLGTERKLSRLEINYTESNKCKKLSSGYVEISTNQSTWDRLPGTLPDDWRISYLGEQPKDGHFIEPFVGQNARIIHLSLEPQDTCLRFVNSFKIYYLE